jgi:hypothetical protein
MDKVTKKPDNATLALLLTIHFLTLCITAAWVMIGYVEYLIIFFLRPVASIISNLWRCRQSQQYSFLNVFITISYPLHVSASRD